MRSNRYEAMFLWLAAGMLFLFAGAIMISGSGLGIQLPGFADQIAPGEVDKTAGFDNPGVHQVDAGRYEVYMIGSAQDWTWTPNKIDLPAGSEVTFFLASKDVIHGFKVLNTNINVMVIPGQIAEVTYTFRKSGEYPFYCTEYCGSGHSNMAGMIVVSGD
jgi:cytochrome c oxidase subunit 2